MVRRFDDPVAVRGDGPPREFLWRGRLYVVRAVLSHWFERGAWWEGAAGRAVHGEDGGSSCLDAVEGLRGGEREVWRVEASAGRAAGAGVYDLCAVAPGPAGPAGEASWRLLRLAD